MKQRSIPGDPEGIDLILLIDEDRTAELQGGVAYGSESRVGIYTLKIATGEDKINNLVSHLKNQIKIITGFALDFYDPWIKIQIEYLGDGELTKLTMVMKIVYYSMK